jgi:uncharacterized membrane protein
MRLVHLLNGALLLGLIGLSLYVYPELPARIPLHFGADGTPDRWGERTLLSWMILPLVGAGTALLMYVIGLFIPGRPQSFNFPDRDKLLALPAAVQEWVMRGVVDMLHIMTLALLLMFCGMQYGAWESSRTGVGSRVMVGAVLFSLVAMPFVTVAFLVVVQRRMDRAWRAHRTGASP